MNNVNSIRPDDGTSLLALCEVRSAAQASGVEDSRPNGKGKRDSGRVLKETVNERKSHVTIGGWLETEWQEA